MKLEVTLPYTNVFDTAGGDGPRVGRSLIGSGTKD